MDRRPRTSIRRVAKRPQSYREFPKRRVFERERAIEQLTDAQESVEADVVARVASVRLTPTARWNGSAKRCDRSSNEIVTPSHTPTRPAHFFRP
jgi:hypothetical protein